ncbi:MAG: Crp/Fnr family transcriptional regulator [Clostridiaceae bacterium]|nr:Crp/Fnr family transcriptional regulator [Clostridiaceae bacterium]
MQENDRLKNITSALSMQTLFAGFTNEQLNNLLSDRRCLVKFFQQGQIVHIEGEPCQAAEIILNGEIAIERISEEGTLMLVARFGPGDILGGNLVFSSNSSFPMTITCRQNSTILALQNDLLLELMHNNKSVLLNFLRIISDNTSLLSGKIRQTINRTLRQRILDYIEIQINSQGSKTICLTMTKKELAEYIGVQRTSLSRELRKMKDDGLIDYDSETITRML